MDRFRSVAVDYIAGNARPQTRCRKPGCTQTGGQTMKGKEGSGQVGGSAANETPGIAENCGNGRMSP